MDRSRTRRLARAIIAPAVHTDHPDERLESCLDLAIATYQAMAGPPVALTVSPVNATSGTDDLGAYTRYTIDSAAAARALADPAADLTTAAGDRPRIRIESLTASQAIIRIYQADLTGSVTIWTPSDAWPATRDAAIAMLTAAYYIAALALAQADPRRGDTLSDLASTYYGRATQLIRRDN